MSEVTVELSLEKGVRSFEDLILISKSLREQGKRLVLCHGVFDLLHVGHIRHLRKGKEAGDVLMVTLTPDHYVNKGPNRPAFSEDLRAEAISSLDFVDYVAINLWPQAMNTIKELRPHFYVKGKDYKDASQDKTGGILLEKEALNTVGGEMIFTEELTFSSSSLINKHMPLNTEEMNEFLRKFSENYSYSEIETYIERLRSLKVLVLGESIIDDYHYCRTMGKPGKDPILAVCHEKEETFIGGILAIANHLAEFSDHVSVLSFLGKEQSYESFVRERLNKDVDATFLKMSKSKSSIVKRRFLERYPLQKLFEVYVMENDESNAEDSENLCQELEKVISDYDLVVVADYGHGMMTPDVIDLLEKKAKFLAVNTQLNAGNQGFNTVSKYPKADFVCISENELRIDARNRKGDLEQLIKEASKKLDGAKILITRGSKGVCCYDPAEGFFETPAFVGKILDRVGAGDSVLSVASLAVASQVPTPILGLIGNAVGFQAVQAVGNRNAISKVSLLKTLEHCLK